MKAKAGYREQKTRYSTCKFLHRYWEKRTCRRVEKGVKEDESVCDGYEREGDRPCVS